MVLRPGAQKTVQLSTRTPQKQIPFNVMEDYNKTYKSFFNCAEVEISSHVENALKTTVISGQRSEIIHKRRTFPT